MPLLFLSLLSFTLRSTSTSAAPIDIHSLTHPLLFPRFTDPINPSVDTCLYGTPFYTNYRSLWDIVWACWVTIFACVWISVHPNVRGHKATWGAILRQRAELLFWGLIAPEVTVIWAYRQWRGAKAINEAVLSRIEKIKEEEPERADGIIPWTITHAHLLQMGGYIFEKDGIARYINPSFELVKMPKEDPQADEVQSEGETQNEAQQSPNTPAEVKEEQDPAETAESKEERDRFLDALIRRHDTEEELQDRSKGDAFAKGVVVIQTLWFIMQIIARRVQNLAITQLEVTTLAYAAMTAAMYLFWWYKPLDVQCPIIVSVSDSYPQPLQVEEPTPSSSKSEHHIKAIGRSSDTPREADSDNHENEVFKGDRLLSDAEQAKLGHGPESQPPLVPVEEANSEAKGGPSVRHKNDMIFEGDLATNASLSEEASASSPNFERHVKTTGSHPNLETQVLNDGHDLKAQKEQVFQSDLPIQPEPAIEYRFTPSNIPEDEEQTALKFEAQSTETQPSPTPSPEPGRTRVLFLRLEQFFERKVLPSEFWDDSDEYHTTVPLSIRLAIVSILSLILSPFLLTVRLVMIILASPPLPTPNPIPTTFKYASARISFPTFYAYSRDVSASAAYVTILIGSVFGAIHCAAWSFTFNTHAHQVLWRASALFISVSPCGTMFIAAIFAYFDESRAPKWAKAIGLGLVILMAAGVVVLYAAGRWILVILTLIELSRLPPTAYQTVEWTDFLPHA